MPGRADAPRPASTRQLLDEIATGNADDSLRLGDLLQGLGDRSFGMLLIAASAPAFIPIPGVAGALSGPLVSLLGLQLLVLLRKPLLPRSLARRGPRRSTMARFRNLLSPWLARLERFVRPRLTPVLEHWAPRLVTGLLVLVTGLLLWLPIPFTNYLLAVLVLLFALALLERDGLLMLVAWASSAFAIASFGALADTAVRALLERF